MKKLISTLLAAVMISSCVVTPAFAYPSEVANLGIGEIQYGEGKYANSKINAFNTDARVYPTSQAPAMKNTKTINGVTFSEYIKHKEVELTADNGEKYKQVSVWLGVDSAMHASAKDARFVYHYASFVNDIILDEVSDGTCVTGERFNWKIGDKFHDLGFWDIKPFADNKTSSGEYVGNLTWQFLKNEEQWNTYKENLEIGFTDEQYNHGYSVVAIVDGVQTNFYIITTTNGTPKGDSTPVTSNPVTTTPTTPAPGNTNTGATTPVAPATAVANPTTSKIFVNGKEVAFDAYNINGNNYFKLRDVAITVRKTPKQFEVQWDPTMIYTNDAGQQARGGIALFSGKAYTTVGGEMKKGDGIAKNCVLTTSPITKDGQPVQFTAYNINGNNYFKLRDLGEAFDFNVSWDGQLKAVVVNTSESYVAD